MRYRVRTSWRVAVAIGVMAVVLWSQGLSAAEIPLVATAAAPVGAGGVAHFENVSGGAALVAKIEQLSTGTYALRAIRRRDEALVTLATLVIGDPTAAPDVDANDNKKERGSANQAEALQTNIRVQLLAGLAPGDIAEVQVCGRGGIVLLSGKTGPTVPPTGRGY